MTYEPAPREKRKKRSGIGSLIAAAAVVIAIVIVGVLLARRFGSKPDAALEAYIQTVNNVEYSDDEYGSYSNYLKDLRFDLGYVNDDDIPELFLADGNYHAALISVYTYDPASQTVRKVGGYGSFGICGYFERQDVLFGQYGGQGLWLYAYEGGGADGKRSVLAIEGENMGRAEKLEEVEYYWVGPCEGSIEEVNQNLDLKEHIVSETECNENLYDFLHQYDRERGVNYDKMIPYSDDALRGLWEKMK